MKRGFEFGRATTLGISARMNLGFEAHFREGTFRHAERVDRRSESKPMVISRGAHHCRLPITWAAIFASTVYATFGNARRHYDLRVIVPSMISGAHAALVITRTRAVLAAHGLRTCFSVVQETTHFAITERSNFCVKANANGSCELKPRQERPSITVDSTLCSNHSRKPSYRVPVSLPAPAKGFSIDFFDFVADGATRKLVNSSDVPPARPLPCLCSPCAGERNHLPFLRYGITLGLGRSRRTWGA
jgi:hypothetical protein